MEIGLISLFPEMFDALNYGITGRAIQHQLVKLHYLNPRDYTTDKHRTVDDHPYGGGPGMLMKVQPLQDTITAAKKTINNDTKVIYVSPQGRQFNQKTAFEMAKQSSVIFVAGRYEGIDNRLLETTIDEEWSIGDYVLSGGELAIMVMLDAIIRLLPEALGNETSALQDSFSQDLLDCPHYTRPENINGLKVPQVLLTGDHQAILRWRMKQCLGHTWLKRPDLLETMSLDEQQQTLLKEFIDEHYSRKKS